MVVEAEIFPVVLTCLKDKDEYVKKNACTLIREIAKHTPEVKTNKQLKITLQDAIYLVLVSTSIPGLCPLDDFNPLPGGDNQKVLCPLSNVPQAVTFPPGRTTEFC